MRSDGVVDVSYSDIEFSFGRVFYYSPVTGNGSVSWLIGPDGIVVYYIGDEVWNSYGQADYWWLRSPNIYDTGDACYVSTRGSVDNDYNSNGVRISFGRLFTTLRSPILPISRG